MKMRHWLVLPAALAFSLPPLAWAGKVYRWVDGNGVVHYGDQVPANAPARTMVRSIPVRHEPGSIARLRMERDGAAYVAWVDNSLAGPVEVLLRIDRARNIASSPMLPAKAVVPARASVVVARLTAPDPAVDSQFDAWMASVPGPPGARARDVEYSYPLRIEQVKVGQAFGGSFSHNDAQNRYAVDFAAPIGTPVLAARDGQVMQVESDFDKAGLNSEKYGGRANFVRILHDDGSMAVYAHLQNSGVLARVGQRVRAGQQIGLSGNTGFTSGPHLHFAVQVNRGMDLQSVPFRMVGPNGALRFTLPR